MRQGPTPSEGTGPEAADSGLYYAYLEASNLDKDDDAVLMWNNIAINGSCLSFAYNMIGGHPGQLFVEVRESASSEWVDVFNVTGWFTLLFSQLFVYVFQHCPKMIQTTQIC